MTEVVEEPELGRAAARGGIWGVAGETSSRAAQSICFFVLASVLTPKQFGAAAVAFVCVQVANALTYAGLGAATQVLGPDVRRDRTAVGMAMVSGGAGGLLLAALAGPLCDLLGAPDATGLVRLVALALPLAQTGEVVSALLDRELLFKQTGLAVVLASVVSAVVGLWMAAAGAGAEALVAQGVVQPGARLLFLAVRRPSALRPSFHRAEAGELWGTGKEILVGGVFATASGNVDNVAVSAIAGPAALGGYGFVYNLTTLPYFLVGLAVGRVALPVYATLHARSESVRTAFLTALESTSWLAALPLGYLAVAGPESLQLLFGHKWDYVGWALRVLALHGLLRTIETTSGSVLISLGQADVMRRVQQWQLAAVLVLLGPLVYAKGPLGAAIAVVTAVAVGTAYSFTRASRSTKAPATTMLARVLEAAAGGLAGGAVGLLVLDAVPGAPGLVLSLLAASATWLLSLVVLRPHTVRQGAGLLRKVPERVAEPEPSAEPDALVGAPVAVLDLPWEGSLELSLDSRYGFARVLVRQQGQPAAWVGVPLRQGSATDAELRRAVGDLPPTRAPDLPATGEVCVVVCTVGRPEMLTRVLTSLLALDHTAFEVLVVDNRPATGEARAVVDAIDDRRLRIVDEPVPGLSAARNRGIAESTAPILAFTDDDAVVDPQWLRWLTAPLVAQEASVSTGLVLPLELETPAQLHFEGYGGFARGMVRRSFDLKVNTADDHLVYPFSGGSFGSGNSMAFTRACLEEIGGFDVALGAGSLTGGGEDIDAFSHLVLRGHTLVYEPRAVCWHEHRRDPESLDQQVFTYGTGFGAVQVKWLLRSNRMRWGLLRKLGTLLQALRPGRPKAAAARESPPELSVLELRGMLASPRLYLRARRVARGHSGQLARIGGRR
ncbi:MAG: glycosyl transferase family 2 [Frankiales bacterium]|nr:glycosyl transferase family 2 [Frankiales bacterium]